MDLKPINAELLEAIRLGNLKRLTELFFLHPEKVKVQTPFGTWLHSAATYGHVHIAAFLIDKGIDSNQGGGTLGGGALNLAAAAGHFEMVEYLLARGAVLDVSQPERNPLFAAIYGGHSQIVELLLRQGIDKSVKYSGDHMHDMDAEAFARERGQLAIATILGRVG